MPQAQLRQDRTLEIRTVYRDVVIGTRYLAPVQGRLLVNKRRGSFRIGSGVGIDAPVAPRFVPTLSHVLVDATSGEPEIHATPLMTGEVDIGEQRFPLLSFVQQRGLRFRLPDDGRATVKCGEITFLITPTTMPARMPARPFVWRWSEMIYPVGAAVVLGLFLLMIFAVPGDANALSLDHLGLDHHLIKFDIKPPVEIPVDKSGPGRTPQNASSGRRSTGQSGTMGDVTSSNRRHRHAIKGPTDNPDPRLAKETARLRIQQSGILGVLARSDGAHLASILGQDNALGSDVEDVLGDLVGTQIGDAYGIGGLHLTGTGESGDGTHEGTIGTHDLHTIGPRDGLGLKWGSGRPVAALGLRQVKPIEFMPGPLSVRGSLDKEVIRRIVRHHLNEVKYCYELELARAPGLAGRVVVQFAIAPGGHVITSALQSSTMGNARVENCTVQAIRRWSFPAPTGGGLVVVSYPFVLNPAGGP
ncbi:MAG TPA: AgmX/PglI C-terminal domain-containing protein [Polyangia bacterium]|jgi:TonB family protein|nr:AgmX/PglI C-terminal domain-containing protein [Polyangia bacterium]